MSPLTRFSFLLQEEKFFLLTAPPVMRERFYNMKNEEWKAISKQDMACKNTLNFVFVVVEASRIIFLNFTVAIYFFPGFNGKENPSTV